MYRWSFPKFASELSFSNKSIKDSRKRVLDILEVRRWMSTNHMEFWWWHNFPVNYFDDYLELVEFGNLDRKSKRS